MKNIFFLKRCFVLFIALILCVAFPFSATFSALIAETTDSAKQAEKNTNDSATTYAYLSKDVMLYTVEQNQLVVLSTLPRTYFVAILDDATLPSYTPPSQESETDVTASYYKVNYLNLVGFVKKTDVEVVDYEPVTKYASPTLTPNNDGFGANLRAKPQSKSQILGVIPHLNSSLYYGKIEGDELVLNLGKRWYYVKYIENNIATFGYVYSGHVAAEEIPPNKIEKVEKPKEPNPAANPPTFTSAMSIVFIVCLSLPAVIVMLLLFKKKNNPKTPRNFDE